MPPISTKPNTLDAAGNRKQAARLGAVGQHRPEPNDCRAWHVDRAAQAIAAKLGQQAMVADVRMRGAA